MQKIVTLFFLFVFAFGMAQSKKADVYFEIQQKEVRDSTLLQVKLVNHSKQNIWLALDTIVGNQEKSFLSYHSFFKGRRISEHFEENTAEEKYTMILVTRSSCDDEAIRELPKIDTFTSLILLGKGESMLFSYLFVLKKGGDSNYLDSKEYVVDTNKKNKYSFSMSYIMDDAWISSNVEPNVVEALEKANFVPYNVVIKSNSIPYISKK